MDSKQIAEIVRQEAGNAVNCYLEMCHLDSPWEVPESFLVSESAKALAKGGLRVALEFKLDRASNHPSPVELQRQPVRLQRAHAKLDLAILRSGLGDPWQFVVDGIIEFKKHSSLDNDAELINFLKYERSENNIIHGILVLLVVGSSKDDVINKENRLITNLTAMPARWQQLASASPPTECRPLGGAKVGDPWWTICCLVLP